MPQREGLMAAPRIFGEARQMIPAVPGYGKRDVAGFGIQETS